MRVASTGPYEVMVVSQNGWRMTATGAPTSNAAERITYRYELLGQTLDSGQPNFTPVRCEASGLAARNSADRDADRGGRQASFPNYRDIITITVTPLAVTVSDTERCN